MSYQSVETDWIELAFGHKGYTLVYDQCDVEFKGIEWTVMTIKEFPVPMEEVF